MAVIFHKEPNNIIYPAYNNSYILFKDDGVYTEISAEITVAPFNKPFTIFPDLNGFFQFNLLEITKVIFGQDGFEDGNDKPLIDNYDIVNDRLKNVSVMIEVIKDGVKETIVKNYEFSKSVKQIGEKVYPNETQLLSKSSNGIDYDITYFEGWEFSLEFLKVTTGDDVMIRNLNSGDDVIYSGISTTGTIRLWVDKVVSNWISTNHLPLSDTVNRLELWVNGTFRTNINLKKVHQRCGVYLKWFNNESGYNYFLFDEYFKKNTTSKSLGAITRNEFTNVNESPKSFTYNQGQVTGRKLSLKATLTNDEIKYVESIISSPAVQMYTSNSPYVIGEWVTIDVSGNIIENTKRNTNDIIISADMPVQFNITY